MIKRVHIKNFRSLANVVVDLEDFTILVGPNGSGKSNFLDALHFLSTALNSTLQNALSSRGSLSTIFNRFQPPPPLVGIRIEMTLDNQDEIAVYAFEIGLSGSTSIVIKEICEFNNSETQFGYEYASGKLVNSNNTSANLPETIEPDRLALQVVSAIPEFRKIYDNLANVRFYDIDPDAVRYSKTGETSKFLSIKGENCAGILDKLQRESPEGFSLVNKIISTLIPGIEMIDLLMLDDNWRQLLFFHNHPQLSNMVPFMPIEMSDGTLRILGILLAVFQPNTPSLLAIEEPELTVHPAITEVIFDVLSTASERTQVIITTHSPDLLDHKELEPEQIRFVEMVDGQTTIGPIDKVSKDVVRERLFSIGDLLRKDKLSADIEDQRQKAEQFSLFNGVSQE